METSPEVLDFQKRWKPRFFTIWTGQAFSLLGSSLVQFALIWWITQKTGSATILATVTLVSILPQIVLGPLAGALVDRWSRRVVMMVADSLIAGVSLILVYLFATGTVQVWHIFAVSMIRSAGGAFHWPAMSASTSLMVPEKQLSRVAGLNQTLGGAMSIIAPPLGALLVATQPMASVLMIDVVTAVMAVVPLVFILVPQPPRLVAQASAGGTRPSVWQDFRAGLRYVTAWPGLMIILVMATVINFLFSPAFSLMPLLVTKHFQGGAYQLGLMNSVFGVGVVAGGLILSAWGGFHRRIATTMLGLIGMGSGMALIGFTPSNLFPLAVVGMTLAGLMNPIANGPLFALVQAAVAPEMQGRVITLISSAAALMSPLGLAVAGPLSDAIGIQVWFIAGGLVCAAMGAGAFFVKAVMNVEEDRFGHAAPVLTAAPLAEPLAPAASD
jgi:MFS transporter, DHA3 family, macrolide efflux protein